jgi:hypothetical protein
MDTKTQIRAKLKLRLRKKVKSFQSKELVTTHGTEDNFGPLDTNNGRIKRICADFFLSLTDEVVFEKLHTLDRQFEGSDSIYRRWLPSLLIMTRSCRT